MEDVGNWNKYSPVNGFLILFDFVHEVPKKFYALGL